MINANNAKIANWMCSALAMVILLIRITLTRYRFKSFNVSAWLCIASLLTLVARMIVNRYYLSYGTSNDVLGSKMDLSQLSASELERIKIGSILALMARLLITTFYWLQVCLLLLFYTPITSESGWTRQTIRICWITIAATYLAVVFATFFECHPFRLYWQINPPPGRCVRAYVQVFLQCCANIILDLFLLVIAFPVLGVHKRSRAQTFRIGILFCMGFFCIIVNCVRVGYIYSAHSSQSVRSFWASIQMFVAAFVANMPTIYGCYHVLRRQKSESMIRRASRPEQWLSLSESHNQQRPVSMPNVDQSGHDVKYQEAG